MTVNAGCAGSSKLSATGSQLTPAPVSVRKRNRCLDFQFLKKGKCINEEEAQRKSHDSNMSELEYLGEYLLFYSLLQKSIKREV